MQLHWLLDRCSHSRVSRLRPKRTRAAIWSCTSPTLASCSSATQRVDEARAGGKTLEAARGQIDLSDLRRQFAGDSPVHGALFDAYVAGPAVTNAWNIR